MATAADTDDARVGTTERFPFGLTAPFTGLELREKGEAKALLRYVPNKKQAFAHNCTADEIFYGGAVFGGKSFFLIMHNAAHCLNYGKHANTVLFRRSYDELEGSLISEQRQLFPDDPNVGHYLSSPYLYEWANGAHTWFRHLQDEDALMKHRSRQYTLVAFDELTDFLENEYLFLFQRLRSPKDPRIHPQMISASNPRGIGHRWVYERFIKGREPFKLYSEHMDGYSFGEFRFTGRDFTRVFVPARVDDNIDGMANDPEYLGRMKKTQSPDLYKAYVEGDWELFEGMAFGEWDPKVHIVKSFTVPQDWKVIRALDWGYSSPFSVGWLAQDPDTKAIYRVDEWYGARRGDKGGHGGLQMSAREVRQNLMAHERQNVEAGNYPRPWYGVADPSIWSQRAGEATIGDLLNEGSTLFRPGNRDRKMGKQVLHRLLRLDSETGKPGFMVFDRCKDFIRTVPLLALDEKDPEDVDTKQEDHIYDENRYGIVELTQAPASRQARIDPKALKKQMQMPVLI